MAKNVSAIVSVLGEEVENCREMLAVAKKMGISLPHTERKLNAMEQAMEIVKGCNPSVKLLGYCMADMVQIAEMIKRSGVTPEELCKILRFLKKEVV